MKKNEDNTYGIKLHFSVQLATAAEASCKQLQLLVYGILSGYVCIIDGAVYICHLSFLSFACGLSS